MNPQKGSVAIIMVLITLAMITTIVIEIMYKSQVTATVVTNRRDGEKAYELARSAIRWSILRLQLDNTLDNIPAIPGTNYGGKKDDLSEMQWAAPLPYPFATSTMANAIAGKQTDVQPDIAKASELGGSFISTITDESAKINLNDVGSQTVGTNSNWSGASEVLENLLLSPRFQPFFKNADHRNIMWAIDDWIDADSEVNHTGGGIEDVEYQTEDRNLHVKNGPFYSVEEVRLLKPMTDELFQELTPFITVYPFDARIPKSANMPPAGLGWLNVNTAPVEIIASTFSRQVLPGWKERYECAQKLVKYRKNVVFRSRDIFIASIPQVCGINPDNSGNQLFNPLVKGVLSVRSDTFAVEAMGNVEDVSKTIKAVISRANDKIKILSWKVL